MNLIIYYESNKTTTSCFDDERYIKKNRIGKFEKKMDIPN